MTVWAYDLTAPFYDEDMGRNADARSVGWYVGRATAAVAQTGTPVLELGCGTGRITLPLAASGLDVVAIDRSLPMLDVLSRKLAARPPAGRVRPLALDMRQLDLDMRFAAILCPFSALSYVVDAAERTRTLAAVKRHLAPGGLFVLDMFIPDPTLDDAPAGVELQDYRRDLPPGWWGPAVTLVRTKRLTRTGQPGVRAIHRAYRFFDDSESVVREVRTSSLQRSYRPEELLSVLAAAGFADPFACGDFDAAVAPSWPARTVVITARAEAR